MKYTNLTRPCNLTPQPDAGFAINPAKPASACYAVDGGVGMTPHVKLNTLILAH